MVFYKKKEELTFEGNKTLAKLIGYQFCWDSKQWCSSKAITTPQILDIIKGFAVIKIENTLVYAVDYDNRELAHANNFKWNKDLKRWEKEMNDDVSAAVDFSEVSEREVLTSDLLKSGVKTELYEFQRKAVAKLIAKKRCYNGSDMGTGKTLISIASYMLVKNSATKLLVICPASLKYTWQSELLKHTSLKSESINIVQSKLLNTEAAITIINYDILAKNIDALHNANFNFIICDEAHFIKNMSAARTKVVLELTNNVEYVQLLSGTPITRNAADFFTATQILDVPFITALSQYQYYDHFCHKKSKNIFVNGASRTIVEYYGIKNADKFRSCIYPKFLRFEANSVDLPEQIHMSQIVDLSANDKKEIKNLMTDLGKISDDNDRDLEALAKNSHLAKVKSFVALVKAKKTADKVLELLEEDGEKQIVVYSDHLASSAAIVNFLRDKKVVVEKIDGSVSTEKRNDFVNKFQSGAIKVIVGTSAIATGLTLTAADIMIINDASYNVATNLQLYKRIHRISQKNRCKYYHMTISMPGVYDIDANIKRIVLEKEATIKKAIG